MPRIKDQLTSAHCSKERGRFWWVGGWVGEVPGCHQHQQAPHGQGRYEGSHLLAGSRFTPMRILFGVFSFSKWTRYCVLNLYSVYVEKETTHGFPYRRRRRRTPPLVCFFLATLMYGCCSKGLLLLNLELQPSMSMARTPTKPLVNKNCKPFFPQKTIT